MSKIEYQPKTGTKCHCKPGISRDNCPDCEGTGWRIDFCKIRSRSLAAIASVAPLTAADYESQVEALLATETIDFKEI